MSTQGQHAGPGSGEPGAECGEERTLLERVGELVSSSLTDEEHRWVEIGSEAERALERGVPDAHEEQALLALVKEREVRVKRVAKDRERLLA